MYPILPYPRFAVRKFGSIAAAALTLFCSQAAISETNSTVEETRSTLKEWIHIQEVLSQEKNAWTVEKAVLENMVQLLLQEEKGLTEQITENKNAASLSDKKRAELNLERKELNSAMEAILPRLVGFEGKIKALYASFPPPLQEEASKLYNRLPRDPGSTAFSASERLLTIIGILAQADKFNCGVQKESEIRQIGGRQAEVQTLYFGLATAYFSDQTGKYAGIGYPGSEGWTWEEIDSAGPAILRMIQIYDGTRDPEFTKVPFTIH